MKVRDLFAGRAVQLKPFGDRWLVGLADARGNLDPVQVYPTRAHALQAAERWMLALTEDHELLADDRAVLEEVGDRLLEWLQCHDLAESEDELEDRERARLRAWFEREIQD